MGPCQSKNVVQQVAVDNTSTQQSSTANNNQQQFQPAGGHNNNDQSQYSPRRGHANQQQGGGGGGAAAGRTTPSSGGATGHQQRHNGAVMNATDGDHRSSKRSNQTTTPTNTNQQQQLKKLPPKPPIQQQRQKSEGSYGGGVSDDGSSAKNKRGHRRRPSRNTNDDDERSHSSREKNRRNNSGKGDSSRRRSKSGSSGGGFVVSMGRPRRSENVDDTKGESLKAPSRKHSSASSANSSVDSSLIITNPSKWKHIWYEFGYTLLVDPIDVHSVIQEQISKVMNRMSNQDLLFIQRRIRHVIKQQFLSQSTERGGSRSLLISSNSGSNISNSNQTTQSNKSSTNPKKMMSRFYNAAAGGGGGGSGSSQQQQSNPNTFLGVENGKKVDTKTLLEKYHLLNEEVVRKAFNGCNDLLLLINANKNNDTSISSTATAKTSSTHNRKRSTKNTNTTVVDTTTKTGTTNNQYNNTFWSMIEIESNGMITNSTKNKQSSTIPTSNQQQQQSDIFDPIHCAYILMSSFHSNNWDILQSIAIDTAKYANINMDVNKQIQQQDDKNNNEDSSSTSSSRRKNSRNKQQQSSTTTTSIPSAPSFIPSLNAIESISKNSSSSGAAESNESNNSNNTNNTTTSLSLAASTPPPTLDNGGGVTFNNLCYVISLGLYGTRTQKLHLLWYLLLSPSSLKEFLYNHPSGCTLPTFLLEVNGSDDLHDDDVILSLSSLAHYYHYSDDDDMDNDMFIPKTSLSSDAEHYSSTNITSTTSSSSAVNENDSATKQQPTLSSLHVIDILATLLFTTTTTSTQNNTGNSNNNNAVVGEHNNNKRDPTQQQPTSKLVNGSHYHGGNNNNAVVDGSLSEQQNGSGGSSAVTMQRNNSAGHLGVGVGGIFAKRNKSSSNLADEAGVDGGDNGDKNSNENDTTDTTNINKDRIRSTVMSYLDDVRIGNKAASYYENSNGNSILYDKSYKKFCNASKDIILNNYSPDGDNNNDTSNNNDAAAAASAGIHPPTATAFNSNNKKNSTATYSETTRWTIHNFAKWADDSLDDTAVNAIFHRIFGSGVLPNPSMERDLVQQKWIEWQNTWTWSKLPTEEGGNGDDDKENGADEYGTLLDYLSPSCRSVFQIDEASKNINGGTTTTTSTTISTPMNDAPPPSSSLSLMSKVWGGVGGYDGRGGLGYGILYCIDKKWWDTWVSYVGWKWDDIYYDSSSSSSASIVESSASSDRRGKRPGDLSTERLLERASDSSFVAGTFGSYELMKGGLRKNVDYVFVPPSVWDVLYELYGGGPPLPRMVLPQPPKAIDDSRHHHRRDNRHRHRDRTLSTDSKQMEDEDIIANDMSNSVEVVKRPTPPTVILGNKPLKIPEQLMVATHPWIIHAHLCDAQQPYRRGDAGPITIRLMATSDQPLWRMYAELIGRLPTHNLKAADRDGYGRARIWKRVDSSTNNTKDSSMRYGPWSLLCKNRYAILPLQSSQRQQDENNNNSIIDNSAYSDLKQNWEAYADHSTVESIGLCNGNHIMVEYAVLNKENVFAWPREAAAKAGRVRHLAEEDAKFRRLMKGVDENGNPLANPPKLEGMTVDAMDQSGRWYQVEILQVESNDTDDENDGDDEEEVLESSEGGNVQLPYGQNQKKKRNGEDTSRQVRVDFGEYGGHVEWIDIDSDRLAKAGRFTVKSEREHSLSKTSSISSVPASAADVKKATQGNKKSNDVEPNGGGKVCTFPGYGACGLANLGNTCYMNSAVQCISYFPLLRAYLISGRYRAYGDLNKDNPLGTGGKLLEEFAELLRVMWSGKYGERSPTRFRSQLGRARSQFSGADQQDAQELLSYMMDVLHEDSNRVKKKPYVEALEDDWVKKTSLPRVGQEAWRRFLRRNRSIMADIAHGQVLNTVTCPVCNHSSRIFDPFNLLSLPFPTVADVYFQCTVIRRASAFNCPQALNRSKKGEKKRERFERRKTSAAKQPPSDQLVFEQYVIAMSRLADIGDLRMQLQNISGIPSNRMKLCKVDEVIVMKEVEESDPVMSYLKVNALPDKEGPCVQVAKNTNSPDEVGTTPSAPTQILALELTLNPRPTPLPKKDGKRETNEKDDEEDEETADEYEEEDEEDSAQDEDLIRTPREERALKDVLEYYGDAQECRIYDSDPLQIAKAISRRLWPKTEKDFKLGLRVDAIDHRNHWFPGSVVEIIEGVASEHGDVAEKSDQATETKVRIHFDNFSSKWDETYSIEQFRKKQVRPLYSHATPRGKPTEFLVHHRYYDRYTKNNGLFGQTFFIQCQNEWSTARAGAHILAQAARFLSRKKDESKPVDLDEVDVNAKVRKIYERIFSTISELIDLLVDCDRQYVRYALGISDDGNDGFPSHSASSSDKKFDSSALSTALIENVRTLLFKLPFEVRVCAADLPLGAGSGKSSNSSGNEEVPFPFSLMRAVGNFMNARHCVVLHWREPPVEKKSKTQHINYLNASVMYVKPELAIHKSSLALLDDHQAARKSKNSPGSGGLHLGVCLSEFCKVNKLHLTDNWRCPRCKDFREGDQNMDLWKLPDLLTFHIKRFNCSARWREKITTKVNFPLTGLDMSEWCHKESPARQEGRDSCMYDLIGVLNHYGGMTGGHYVATCKATACGTDGSEEVAYDFNGEGASSGFIDTIAGDDSELTGGSVQTGWRLGRSKDKEAATNQSKVAAAASAKAASESSEPLWLQFDDELVEPIPPRNVVSEMAYVLFYRRRRITPSNLAKYSTLE